MKMIHSLPVMLLTAAFISPLVSFAQEDAGGGPDTIDARITSVDGDVTVFYHDQGEQGVDAAADMLLDAGDKVKTGPESRAEVGLDGDSVIEIGPDSEFEVAGLERKNAEFGLNIGSLLSKVRSLFANGGRMDIRTPTAVASVRGTEFAVEQDAQGQSHVGVFDEGKVVLSAPGGTGGERLLQANQEASVEKGFRPSEVRIGQLKRFKARRARMLAVRRRAQALRKHWEKISPQNRREMRKKLFERRRDIRQEIREKRSERQRNRQERREKRAR